jgi:integrase
MAQVARDIRMLGLARRYVAHRQMLGYKMTDAGRVIAFAEFMDRAAPGQSLTAARALEWVTADPTRKITTQVGLLSTLRGFARYCLAFDPRTQIPPAGVLGRGYCRLRPHIYTAAQVRLILRRTRSLTTHYGPLHPLTYETFIGLMACTGMRSGEARRLKLADFNPRTGQLRIAPFKASPERTIPLHATAVRALTHYAALRRRCFPFNDSFFVGVTGRPLGTGPTESVFNRLVTGIASKGDFPRPRMTDFRHTFASHWIAEWSVQAKPVSHHLLLLARYLGHKNFASTWWYVTSDPRSLRAAADTFRRFHHDGPSST